MPEKTAVPKSIEIVSPAVRPDGVTNVSVWFDTTLGAESESVSLKEMTFAASAKRKAGNPIDHIMVARVATRATAWSIENVVFVLIICSTLYLAYSPKLCRDP